MAAEAVETTVASEAKIGQSGHVPQQGHDPGAGELRISATDARQGVRVGMWRILAISLVAAVLAMAVAFYLR